jgi:hypothetical protein
MSGDPLGTGTVDIRVRGPAPSAPFLSARDLFETEFDLGRPVEVRVTDDPGERTRTGHAEDRHVLITSRRAATGAMARELALHEYAHMRRHEDGHPSHVQSTTEALFLALAGVEVDRRTVAHCRQIANHMKDIYADDLTLAVDTGEKLVSFLESRLATAVVDQSTAPGPGGVRFTATSDPPMTAVNAAFALALVERHDLVDSDHRIYDLAHAADDDARSIDHDRFKRRFLGLEAEASSREYREALVGATRAYASAVTPTA